MNDMFTLLHDLLMAEFAEQGIAVQVVQSYGDIPPAREQEPLIVVQHLATERVGWQSHQARRRAERAELIEQQNHAETFQISVRLPTLWPTDRPEAMDLLTTAAMFLQGPRMVEAAKKAQMGVQAVKTLTSNYIQNEQKQWENLPRFELVICRKLTLSHDVGTVEQFTHGIYPV